MGQKIGKAKFVPGTEPFINLPKELVRELWKEFNLSSEGWGLNPPIFCHICSILGEFLNQDKAKMDRMAQRLFQILDTDKNDLVDGLELISSLGVVSGMDASETVEFVFACYDFGETSSLTQDELTLLCRSTSSGLCKLTGAIEPQLDELTRVAERVFKMANKNGDNQVTLDEFRRYAEKNPIVGSWIHHFDDVDVVHPVEPPPLPDLHGSDVEKEGNFPERTEQEEALFKRLPFNLPLEEAAEGDEFMASRPWYGTIVDPSEPPKEIRTAPDSAVKINWVHGYRSQDVRNNLRYTASGAIAYHAAALGITVRKPEDPEADPSSWEQRFNLEATDDVTTLAITPDGKHCATGEVGKQPKIIIWDADSMSTNAVLVGFHQRAIQHLDFSSDGSLLASIGKDNENSLAIYDWKLRTLIFSSKTGPQKVLDLRWMFGGNNSVLVSCGDKHVSFWTKGDGATTAYVKKKGIQGSKFPLEETMLCLSHCGKQNEIYSGSIAGRLFVWQGRNCQRAVNAHVGAVNCLHFSGLGGNARLVSGGKDAKVRIWLPDLSPVGVLDVMATNSIKQAVRSVCLSANGQKVLVGTIGSEIYELRATGPPMPSEAESKLGDSQDMAGEHVDYMGTDVNAGAIVQGHFQGELWGLAVNPRGGEFASCGDDWTVRIWNAVTKRQVRYHVLECPSRTIAFNTEGTIIAVGFGGSDGSTKHPKDGGVCVMASFDFSLLFESKDATEWISDIKFSPDGQTLAAGSHDNNIYLYDTNPEWKLRAACSGHSSFITHIDFTTDGLSLHSTCGAYELLFWDTATGEQKPRGASELKDAEWDTWTCPLGYPVQGIWPAFADGNDINAVDRGKESKLLATCDDFGRLKLFNYPCITKGSGFNDYRGHSSHVMKVKFATDEQQIFTVGGHDRCIFQWSVTIDEVEDSAEEDNQEGKAADEEDPEEEENAEPVESGEDEDMLPAAKLERPEKYSALMEADNEMLFQLEEAAAGDEFEAVKPWLGAVVAPQNAEALEAAARGMPEDDLALEWIHGYNARMVRGGVRYNKDGEIVYHGAAVGIVFNKQEWKQRFCIAHTDEITALTMHPDNVVVATGQRGRIPKVAVWDSRTIKTLASLEMGPVRAIWELAFSPDGNLLACAGEDDDHTIAVFSWKEGQLRSRCTGGKAKILALAFNPDNNILLQAGVKHFTFWKLDGRNMTARKGLFGKNGKIQPLVAAAYVNGVAVLGAQDGSIYRVEERKIESEIAKHGQAVNAFCVYQGAEGQQCMISVGKDGKVMKFDAEMNLDGEEIDLTTRGLFSKDLRSVHINPDRRKIVIGTNGSEIFEILTETGADVNASTPTGSEPRGPPIKTITPLITGHCKDELWGLAVHPVKAEYTTVGDDKTLRVWSAIDHKQTHFLLLSDFARAVAYSPNGHIVGVGMGGDVGRGKRRKDGTVCVVSMLEQELRVVNEMEDAKEWISDIKFSPDGTTLAAGSHDNNIYLYDVLGSFALRAVCQAHQSYITHFDFSTDSAWIQSTCGAYELLYFEVGSGQQNPGGASELKDIEWSTWTIPLGWPVQGIWPPLADGTDINAVYRTMDHKYLVTADDFGKIKLMNYPATRENAPFKDYVGHSSHVTNVRVLQDDKYIVSTGGNDKCIFQWRRVFDDQEEEKPEALQIEAGDFDLSNLLVDPPAKGDNFMAVKPWLGAIQAPSKPPKQDPTAPELDLRLEHVHGLRVEGARNTLALNSCNNPVYAAAGLGVIYDKRHESQVFFTGHDDDVISLAVSRDGRHVISGQQGRRPNVFVWSSETGTQICKLPSYHRRGVHAVAFSPDGHMAASIGLDDDHSICLYNTCKGDWSDGSIQAWSANDKDKVLFVTFTGSSDFQIITGGLKNVKFWKIESRNLSCRKGLFGKIGKIQAVTGAVMVQGKCVTGTGSGELYIWEGNRVARAVAAHEKAVNCLNYADGGGFVSGGNDQAIMWWSKDVERLAVFNLEGVAAPSLLPIPISVDIDKEEAKIMVATKASEIYEISIDSGAACLLEEGHYEAEVWGLSTHPLDSNVYATVGDDATLRVWSISTRRILRKKKLGGESRAVSFSPDGTLIACGLNNGSLEVVSVADLTHVFKSKEAREWISDVKFSPDGHTLAVGSHDNMIYLYSTKDGVRFDFYGRLSKHSSYITHFDFSADGQFIRSTCGAYELLFHKVGTGEHLPDGASRCKDTNWASETCVLGWGVQGIWPEESDGTDINSVDRSKDGKYLATADDFGAIKIFNYPVEERECQFLQGKGHSSHVTNIKFNASGTHIVSVGGNDKCVFQWKISAK